jgi:hypothetical protein
MGAVDRESDVLDIDASTRGTADLNPVNHRRSVCAAR